MENKTEKEDMTGNAEVIRAEDSETKATSTFVWIILLLLVCLQAGSFWLWMQQKSLSEDLNQQLSSTLSSVADASTLTQRLQDTDADNNKQLSSLDSKQQLLAERVQELSDIQQITRGDIEQYWALAEVEYLLNVANQRVLLAKDAAGASEALDLADMRIETLSDYRLHPLRALLADEKLALASVVKVDVDGMALQLQSALDSIDSLQILMASPIDQDEQRDTAPSDNWQGVLDHAWQEVKSLVVIRHQQDGTAAVLVPEQRYFLYQNLRLKLETARFALLNDQPSVYDASLNSSIQWLEQYYIGEERNAILIVLRQLQSINTEVVLPDISDSLAWLKGFER